MSDVRFHPERPLPMEMQESIRRSYRFDNPRPSRQGPPICPLHNQPILNKLPDLCPYAAPNRSRALEDLCTRAYARWRNDDFAGGNLDWHRHVTCSRCEVLPQQIAHLKTQMEADW